MWFVFPQIAGLGQSATARHYAIRSGAEARDYAGHPVLGARLRTCVAALRDQTGRSAEQVFGALDAMKLRSSLTLFDAATGDPAHAAVIAQWFGGVRDPMTIRILAEMDAAARER